MPMVPSGAKRASVRPEPAPTGVRLRFVRGRETPRGVAWFGIRSFWGHLRHFAASAIATEDVDSRDWMTPDDPRALMERVSRLLGGTRGGMTVTDRVGRDVWIDYVADTGDDLAVSRAVAGLLAEEYEVPDPAGTGASLLAPRGDVLFFGGDTSYPVATADEIRDRVVVPWNQVFRERDDEKRRVLIGIPGNHDWYDGLDGFGRLFRRHVDYESDGRARPTLHGSTRTMLGHYAEWAREFVRGGQVEKPHTLDLLGYTAVQSASYFVLPLAPGIALLGVDRQLKSIDSRQRFFFSSFLNQNVAVSPWVALPDPVYAFGVPSPTGTEAVRSLGLTLSARPHLVLSGDIHHYRREVDGPTLHITAGGGGAFLHPAALSGRAHRQAAAEWPGVPQSKALLFQVPWKVGLGRSGFIPHLVFAALLGPLFVASKEAFLPFAAVATVVITLGLSFIGGFRKRSAVVLIALLVALATVAVAFALRLAPSELLPRAALSTVPPALLATVAVTLLGFAGAGAFGAFLALITRLGLENTQAFTALDHPGFKHFVRLRVRADGSAIDGFVMGLVDPVRPGEKAVLVDTFTWRSR